MRFARIAARARLPVAIPRPGYGRITLRCLPPRRNVMSEGSGTIASNVRKGDIIEVDGKTMIVEASVKGQSGRGKSTYQFTLKE